MLLAKKTRVDINKHKRKIPKSPLNNPKDLAAAQKTIYSLSFRACKIHTNLELGVKADDEIECNNLCESNIQVEPD